MRVKTFKVHVFRNNFQVIRISLWWNVTAIFHAIFIENFHLPVSAISVQCREYHLVSSSMQDMAYEFQVVTT